MIPKQHALNPAPNSTDNVAEDPVPPKELNEFIKLRCLEFLVGPPLLRSLHTWKLDPSEDSEEMAEDEAEIFDIPSDTESPSYRRFISDPNNKDKIILGLRKRIVNQRLRYAIGSGFQGQLFRKLVLRLANGVRLGIGLCAEADPNSKGNILNHWQIVPEGPEGLTEQELASHDAYSGFRSLFLHCLIKLNCPFKTTPSTNKQEPDHNDAQSESRVQPSSHDPYAFLEKPYCQWTPAQIDAQTSPLYKPCSSKYLQEQGWRPSEDQSPSMMMALSEDSHGFFQRFVSSKLPKDTHRTWELPVPFPTYDPEAHWSTDGMKMPPRNMVTVQCEIHSSSAVVNHFLSHSPLFASQMMLPIRKGSLYPGIEKADIKIGKCVRSARLLMNLQDVEVTHSQRDTEMKEIETRELEKLGYSVNPEDNPANDTSSAAKQTPGDKDVPPSYMKSDIANRKSTPSISSAAKSTGFIREAKARMKSARFSFTLIQKTVKLPVKSTKPGRSSSSSIPEKDGHVKPDPSINISVAEKPTLQQIPMGSKGTRSSKSPKSQKNSSKKGNAKGLRWSLEDADTQIEDLDLRFTHMRYWMPLFIPDIREPEEKPKYHTWNGLLIAPGGAVYVTQSELSWFYMTSVHDIDLLDLSSAVFDRLDLVSVLKAPRVIYFMQHPEYSPLLQMLKGSPTSTFDEIIARGQPPQELGARQHHSSTISHQQTHHPLHVSSTLPTHHPESNARIR